MIQLTPAELQQLASKEAIRIHNALTSMSAFREYMSTTGHVDFQNVPARHHLYLITQLERLERGEIQRLLIMPPPGSAKSTYASIQYPLQRLAKRPDENILCASNTQSLAEEFNRRRRNAALMPEWSRLSRTTLAPDKQGVEHFTTLRQGGIRASGVGSSIVGFRSKLNILDDPITGYAEAMSAGTLEKQWTWYNQDFRPRLVKDGQELVISTRWAKRDIPGRILERVQNGEEEWEVVRLPMEADRDDDPLDRARGENLWPEWFGDKKIAELKRDAFLWNTQFQQTPLDETGSWVTKAMLEYCFEDAAPTDLKKVIGFDLALSVGKGDYTVIVVAGLCSQGLLHILRPLVLPNGKVGLGLNAGLEEMFEDRERAHSRIRGRV